MAAKPSSMLPLGTALPTFRLQDAATGAWVESPVDSSRAGTLVIFMCNHCPYVVHLREVLVKVANDAVRRGLAVWAINSNSVATHPQDGPEAMKRLSADEGFTFPFLFDDTQSVARAFDAQCTPEFYLFNGEAKLVYRGQFDDSRPSNSIPVTGRDLSAAIDALLSKRPVSPDQRPSIGCSIKWHPATDLG